MATDFLSLIGTILNDRARQAAAQQQESQYGRSLESEKDRFNRQLAQQQLEQQQQYGLSLDDLGLRKLANTQQYGLSQEQLALTKRQQEQAELARLAQLVGAGAENPAQADILSLLAGKIGVPLNTAGLLYNRYGAGPTGGTNSTFGGGGTGIGGGGRGGSWLNLRDWLGGRDSWQDGPRRQITPM